MHRDRTPPPTTRQLVEALGLWLLATSAHPPRRHDLAIARGALRPLMEQVIARGDPTARGSVLRLLLNLLSEEARVQGLARAEKLASELAGHDDPAFAILGAIRAGGTAR